MKLGGNGADDVNYVGRENDGRRHTTCGYGDGDNGMAKRVSKGCKKRGNTSIMSILHI